MDNRYDDDPIARLRREARPRPPRELELRRGLWLEDAATEFYGEVVAADRSTVTLRDADGTARKFARDGGFLDEDGGFVRLVTPAVRQAAARSASGSVVVQDARARVARAGRIFVEGRHDAELVEQVWGHDLRVEGVVVEYLEGADNLDAVLREFAPAPGRRAGILLDHLVPGSKESRIAEVVRGKYGEDAVLVLGHPYVDVWQAVRPGRLGMAAWPEIPRAVSWKHGVCAHLGWPHESQADLAAAWARILGRVRNWNDLEPAVIGRVEELIDFVTAAA